jgi:acyl transferase domain-containing protein
MNTFSECCCPPLTAAEAALVDPQQRCLLAETAGLAGPDNDSHQTAVAVGIAKLGEPALITVGTAAAVAGGSSFVGTGRALSAAAGRISYTYGLKGQAVSIDTACSSSLVGTHYVRRAISGGECSRGISAGVTLPMNWETTAMFAAAGAWRDTFGVLKWARRRVLEIPSLSHSSGNTHPPAPTL